MSTDGELTTTSPGPGVERGVRQLGYVGLELADVARWRHLLVDVFGLAPATVRGLAHPFRMDDHAHRILVEEGPADDLAFIGLQVNRTEDLEALVERLAAAGSAPREESAEVALLRGVRSLVTLEDPDGLRVELYTGPETCSDPFVPGRPIGGFVAGALGLGHVVVRVADRDRSEAFYRALGMRVTDHGSGALAFLRCNPRHHSVALMPRDLDGSSKRLAHLMLEVQSLDDVGTGLDICLDEGLEVVQGLGRHTNDRAVTFYVRCPSGFEVEYGCGARLVDEATWEMGTYRTRDVWGHRPVGGSRRV